MNIAAIAMTFQVAKLNEQQRCHLAKNLKPNRESQTQELHPVLGITMSQARAIQLKAITGLARRTEL